MELLHILDHPSREFTAFPFWFLNGDLTEEELCRQLQDFAAHGVYGVVLHPRIGLPERIEYLSELFFHYIKTAVKEAQRLGMRVILYDEGMYPSGSANGQVVQGHPDYASRGIALTGQTRPGDQVLAEQDGKFLVARFSGGTLRGIHFGEDDGEPNAPPSADLLNPAAVERFIALTHEQYYAHLAPWFGSTILAFFTDEPSILGRNVEGMFPWTAGFERDFTAAGGCLTELVSLFRGEENASTRLYHQMILEREGEVYYRRLSQWCEAHSIALIGHPHQSDDIEVERWFQIPGQDLALRWVGPGHNALDGIDSTMAHCSADAALLMGRRRNANECLGACNKNGNPWQLSGGDIKWYLDWLAVRGVNLFIPHAFYYSIEGKRRDERPPDVGPNNIWWPYYSQWAGYIQRLSALLTDTQPVVQVAVPCRNRALVPELVKPLQKRQISYCYLPQSVWADCCIRSGELLCRGHRFRAVLGDTAQFAEVAHLDPYHPEQAHVTPDCRCVPELPELRVRHFLRAGTECWLFVNEGEEPLRSCVTLPTAQKLGCFDLWAGAAQQLAGGPLFTLELPRRGSLLVFGCTAAEYQTLPVRVESLALDVPAFRQTTEEPEQVRKTYEAELTVTADQLAYASVTLALQAEEMAELWVNGKPAGTAFWSPCVFELRPLLHAGRNTLKLTVTGSLANRYGKGPVPYGLGVKEELV